MNATLVIVEGRATRKEVRLPLPAKVGRSRDSDLTVVHPSVSRSHCELYEDGGVVMVRDAGSSNGTFVDGNRVSTAQLKPGGKLTIGPLTFQFVLDPADNGASPSHVEIQDTTPMAGPMEDTTEVAREPVAVEELDLEALPEVDEEALELEPLSLMDEPVAEGAAEIELPDFEDAPQPAASSEPALELEPLDDAALSFELADDSAEPAGKTAGDAEASASLDSLKTSDEASPDMLPEIEEADEPEADKQSSGSTAGELTDEELDSFLNELD